MGNPSTFNLQPSTVFIRGHESEVFSASLRLRANIFLFSRKKAQKTQKMPKNG